MRKSGSTWWGKRWIEALESMSSDYSSRLARGRAYARSGRTHDLHVTAGEVTAQVTGSRPTPYRVTIALEKLSDEAWSTAVAAMAKEARFAASLLAGEMPNEIDLAFRAADTSLFPAREVDLRTACTCPDWANPCKHVAAAHYVLGEALDRDPFLLFELRGRTKPRVLAELSAARGAGHTPIGDDSPAVPRSVKLPKLPEDAYDRVRGAPAELHFAFESNAAPGSSLRPLGQPAAWTLELTPTELFGPTLRAAAEHALALARTEATRGAEDPDPNDGS
jgi:uncharacterized Zn finger protein